MKLEWKQINEIYPVNKQRIWLNNCGTTTIGNLQRDLLADYLEDYSRNGVFTEKYSYPIIKNEILSILAKLIGTETRNLALIHNTFEGMSFISMGLSLTSKDTIVLLENEYPSNYYPWEFWKKEGTKIDFIPMQDSPEAYLNAIQETITKLKPTILSLSPVHWCTGLSLPMKEISSICKQYNVKLILDGAQAVGHVPVETETWGVYAMAFSAWKWLLGPLGLGVLYVSDQALDELKLVFKGTQSVVGDSEYLPYKSEIKASADRYEYSTSGYVDWIYFLGSLRMLSGIGFDEVRSRIYELTRYLKEKVNKKAYTTTHDNLPEMKSGILSINPKDGQNTSELAFLLKSKGIIFAERMNRVRVSPHIFLLEDQLDIFAGYLP
ncbi:MAG: aminotransferase class V-fold PLP-dependent enzyme [Leptospiraceae bacterium]|jgi:cysteine desulfurase/selenocysteine lyase|nr:aminotransferase class V-fold PLP-dependent enzyme [Leptospiraceae bacterium]MCZ8346067.1 aminotransferase class V-fold PLP-dependent enzyme [Leptospiraceae bacterium]